jgi:ABC-type bacteriocin/lantibiotic exporter with double-glycine peptidase domain
MFTFSLFTKIMIDKVIPQKLEKTLLITTLSFLFLTILRVFNNYIKSFILKKLEIRINYDITFLYLDKLKNANLNSINKITNTDNLRRIGLIEPISKFIASSFFIIFHESLLFIISTSLLIFTSIKLFSITLFAGFFIFIISFIFKYITTKNYDSLLKENLNVFSNFIEIVNSIDKLKNKNFQNYYYKKFEKDYYNFRSRNLKI